ncbi:MAG TPA: hypothetical protein VIF09_17130 [Polyangiaceae bacterium]|jgi:hypothetical protein
MDERAKPRRGTVLGVALGLSVALAAGELRAQGDPPAPTAEACFSAAEKAQPLMKQRKLSAARRFLQVCTREECPRAVRADCKSWGDELAAAQPTVVFVAREERADGTSVAVQDVRVSVDGSVVASRLEGGSTGLDPGMHALVFERAGFDRVDQRIDLREGERDREVDVVFRAGGGRSGPSRDSARDESTPPPTEPSSGSTPALAYALGGGALVAIGLGVTMEALGLTDRTHLENTCGPSRSCDPSDVSTARNRVAVGDVALGVGALLLGGAVYVALTRQPASPATALRIRLGPTVGGVLAGVEGSL